MPVELTALPPFPTLPPTASSRPRTVYTGLSVKTGIKAPALRTWKLIISIHYLVGPGHGVPGPPRVVWGLSTLEMR